MAARRRALMVFCRTVRRRAVGRRAAGQRVQSRRATSIFAVVMDRWSSPMGVGIRLRANLYLYAILPGNFFCWWICLRAHLRALLRFRPRLCLALWLVGSSVADLIPFQLG